MTRAVNDATKNKIGDIYQYLVALRDCFDLEEGETLQIETNGDVSIINDGGGRFQREVKHHFGKKCIELNIIEFLAILTMKVVFWRYWINLRSRMQKHQ